MWHRVKIWKKNRKHPKESYYDLFDDWNLIESSFLKQYGIRLRTADDMSYEEFCSLLSGIMPDTPLGGIVSIRAEKDPKVIKQFTKEQKNIYNEWKLKKASEMKKDTKAYKDYWSRMQQDLKTAFLKK